MNCNTTHYRANSSSVPGDPTTFVPLGPDDQADTGTTVSEAATGDLPAEDSYAVFLSKAPIGPVSFLVVADGQADLWNGTNWVSSLTLSFTTADWATPKVVTVRARPDTAKEALHFARISHVLTSDPNAFLGLTLGDVARGLVAAIEGDPSNRFSAELISPTKLQITGPGFLATIASTYSAPTIDETLSQRAFVAQVSLTGAVAAGTTWTLTLDGVDYSYTAGAADSTLAQVAAGLARKLTLESTYSALAGSSGELSVVAADGDVFTAAVTAGGGTVVAETSATKWARLVLDLTGTGTIVAGTSWTLTLNERSNPLDAVVASYVAGTNGETTQPKPVDVKIADDDAPGVLIIETGDGTTVAEPSQFVVLGDGFITNVLSSDVSIPDRPRTRFTGDFGTSVIDEVANHDSFFNAQDLELGNWSRNADPEIADLIPGTPVQLEAHLTIRATGNGNVDFYKFTITQAMIDAAGADGVQASFDVDHGYEVGDPIVWASLLKLYNGSEDLLKQGAGVSHPSVGAFGSSTVFDDHLTFSFASAGVYYVEVGSWLFTTGLPNGVDYELNVSIENHPTAGFVFSPAPVLENEHGNDGVGGEIDLDDPEIADKVQRIRSEDFFRFFDPNVGNGWTAPAGTINFQTPYARIQGSGNGSFDIYSFEITSEMLEPLAITPGSPLAGTDVDDTQFFTSVGLRLTGEVREGDRWTLGIRYRDYTYVADANDDLHAVALALADLLPDRYGVVVTTTFGNTVLTITDANGFNLRGVTSNGLSQEAQAAATIERSTEVLDATGTTPISFTEAFLTLSGAIAANESWLIRAGSATAEYTTSSGDSVEHIAAQLASQLAAELATATATGATIRIADGGGFTLFFSVAGDAPAGLVAITGTPEQDEAATVLWTSADLALPTDVRSGEKWTITLTDAAGTAVSEFAVVGGAAPSVASALATKIDLLAGYGATAVAGVLRITRTGGFTVSYAVTPSGSGTVDEQTTPSSRTITLAAPFAGDTWQVTLKETNGTVISTKTASGATVAAAAQALAIELASVSGFRAAFEAGSLTVSRLDGTAFDVVLSIDPAASMGTDTTTVARIVTIGPVGSSDVVHLTVGGTAYDSTLDTPEAIASELAGEINLSAQFTASADGAVITIVALAQTSFDAVVKVDRAVTTTVAGTVQYTVAAPAAAGETWRLQLGIAADIDLHGTAQITTSGTSATTTADQLAAAINAIAGYSALRVGAAGLAISRLDNTTFLVTQEASASLTSTATTVRVESFAVPTGVADDVWRLALTDGGELGFVEHTVGGTSPSSIASSLASLLTGAVTGFAARAAGDRLVLTRGSTADFGVDLLVTPTGAVAARSAAAITFAGTPNASDAWNVTLTPSAGGAVTGTAGSATLGGIVSDLLSDLDGSAFVVVRKGNVLTITRKTPGTFTVARSITPTGSATVATATTRSVTFAGPVNEGDIWTVTLDGVSTDYTISASAANADAIVSAFRTTANARAGYTAFLRDSTVYVTRLTAGSFGLSVAIARAGDAADAIVSGTPKLTWTQDVTLEPSAAGPAQQGDKWTVTIGVTPHVYVASAGESIADIVDGLVAEIGASASRTMSNDLRIRLADGTPAAIAPVKQLRPAAFATTAAVEDDRDHYLTAIVELESDEATGGYSAGEVWTITIDGFTYEFEVPTGTEETRNLRTIAAGLVDAVNTHASAGSRPFEACLESSGARIRVQDKNGTSALCDATVTGDDPFTLLVERGGDGVLGVFDIDGASLVGGTVNVPVVIPGFEDLVAFSPFFRRFFEIQDQIGFVARPMLELIAPDGVTVLHTSLGSPGVDPGSTSDLEPFFEYLFETEGVYYLRVSSFVDWEPVTRFLGLANTFRADGSEGVVPGQSYDLIVSLQRHDTNKDQISLVGKTITIVDGAGKGQTGVIEAYNPETKAYTIDRIWGTNPDASSRFEIAETLDYDPLVDDYYVVLTGSPGAGQEVILNVVPRPTRTYNSDAAFDPDANFGENDEIQVKVKTDRARIALNGTAQLGEKWILTLRTSPNDPASVATFVYLVDSEAKRSLPAMAAAFAAAVEGHAAYGGFVDGDGVFVVTGASAFYSDFRIEVLDPSTGQYTPETQGGSTVATANGKTAIELTGRPTLDETWSLTLDGGAPLTYTVEFRDDLATVARRLAEQIDVGAYEVVLLGRTITVGRRGGGAPVVALVTLAPDSAGVVEITHQLRFTDANWSVKQRVEVLAIDDDFIDGGDALVFAPFEERVNAVRGPVIVDGGIRVSEERFLNDPLMLPGERNTPIPNGSVGGVGTSPDGNGTITDLDAAHVSAQHGERPGFDPRMNAFAYIVGFLDGAARELVFDVESVSADILSLATPDPLNPFAIGIALTRPGLGLIPGAAQFSGTPHADSLAGIAWTQAVVELNGVAKVGETWTLTLGTDVFEYEVPAGVNAPAVIARALEALAEDEGYEIELRVGLLGDTRMIIRKAGGGSFTAAFSIAPAPGLNVDASSSVGGTPVESDVAGAEWLAAAFRFLTAGQAGDTWTISIGTEEIEYEVEAGDTIADVTAALASLIAGNSATSALEPLVSGTTVTFTTGFGAGEAPAAGNEYYVKPFNLNFRVDEEDQVDTLNVFHGNSPANDVGVLTENRLTGLGMGADTVIAGRIIAGGISYSNLEALRIELGTGDDHFTIETTHGGTTTLLTGDGDDTVLVKTTGGHTTVETGDGDDTVRVGNDEQLVDQITGLLTVDTGAGEDTVDVDDSGDENDNTGVLDGDSLTGLDMPRVPEVQTIFVQAASGSYKLTAEGFATTVTLDLFADAEEVADALRLLFGFDDLKVEMFRTNVDVTYLVTFTNERAGTDLPQILWGETREATLLLPTPGASVEVDTATVRNGTTTPVRTSVETIAVDATGGTFVLHFVRPDDEGLIRSWQTAAIAYDATAADVLAAISAVLNPNNVNPALPYTDNIAVQRHGSTLRLFFQGEHRDLELAYVDASGLTGGGVRVETRLDGIDYYGVETLNVALGSGDDVFNVQGTTAVTNLSLGDGDERIYVSSDANVTVAGPKPDYLTGHLDAILGALNIDAGEGRHQLMVSDEAAGVGDADVEIADAPVAGMDAGAATDADIWIDGLAPATITFRADALGTFADGITIWAGSGADEITVTGTHERGGVRTVTTLNTGLGDDVVTVGLDTSDGFFVLNTQGAYDHLLPIGAGLSAGDHETPADEITVTAAGAPVAFVANPALGTIGLTDSLSIGSVVTVTIRRSTVEAFVVDATGVLALATDIAAGDELSVLVNGAAAAFTVDHATNRVTLADPALHGLAVVTIVKTLVETFTLPFVLASDDDVVHAEASTLPLVIFGGQGDDELHGGRGGDVIFGDRGLVVYYDELGNAVTVLGNGGPGDSTDGVARLIGLATSVDTTIGGTDTITSGLGFDVVIGGADDDTITTNRGEAPGQVDAGGIVLGDNGLVDWVSDGDLTDIDLISSLDLDTGGSDTITTGDGDDVVVGGEDGELVSETLTGTGVVAQTVAAHGATGDTIVAGGGRNLVFGDNGRIVAAVSDAARFGSLPITIGLVETLDTLIGGSDSITTGSGSDIVLGGIDADTIAAGDGHNVVLGDSGLIDWVAAERDGTLAGDDLDASDIDRIVTLDPSHGGSDSITTGAGDDVIVGGEDGELVLDTTISVHTASARTVVADLVRGDGDTIVAGGGRNLVFGDAGEIYAAGDDAPRFGAQPLTLGLVTSVATLVGGSDSITTGAGSDVVMGGIDADTILAGDGHNIVLGDSGLIDWAAAERGGALAGDDLDPNDIDRIWTIDPSHGGSDVIETGAGDDLVIAGEDGELVSDVSIAGTTTAALVVSADAVRGDGDVVVAGEGRNLVFGDAGEISAAGDDAPRFGAQPLTLGLVTSVATLVGGSDQITTGAGADIVLGGIDADTIAAGDGHNIVLGDSGLIDWAASERGGILAGDDLDASDIDRILTLDPSNGGNDTITTGAGDDIVIAGEDGELVVGVGTGETLTADGSDGDTVHAGEGRNLVFGDAGDVWAAADDAPRFGGQPLTLGLVTSVATRVGGSDTITTGAGSDIVLGGIDADAIAAGDGHNIVLGDNGLIDWAAAERGGAQAGDDLDPSDLDRIWSLDPDHGGNDTITTGSGDDIVIAGEDGELVVGIGGGETVVADATDGDTVHAGHGHNIVFGDNGQISAATADSPDFSAQPLTLGLVTSIAPTQGGDDTITTGGGRDIVVGGTQADTIDVGNADNIVFGDNGVIVYTGLEYAGGTPGDDHDATDIDRISTFAPTFGGNDTIVSGDGYDLLFGGTADDTIWAGAGNDLVFGDHGKAEATVGGGVIARNLPLSTLADTFTFTSIDVLDVHLGGPDTIYGEDGEDILIGGQGGDSIFAGNDDDDVIGGHNVVGGWDGDEIIDGGAGHDVIAGDNAIVLRRGDNQSRIMRQLAGTLIYDANGQALVTGVFRLNPDGVEGRDITVLDHSHVIESDHTYLWGHDYIAGGADDDMIFGGLGDDVIQGDGSTALAVGASRNATNALVVAPSVENRVTDGDDYVEGGGGDDVIFGNLGQDDLIGGSSDLFGLTTRELRPDGSDLVFGGAGTQLDRNDYGDTAVDGHAQDADFIAGDNATVYRLVGATGAYLTFNYDTYTNGVTLPDRGKLIPRAIKQLDYTPGGADFDAAGAATDRGGADELHGESGDDAIYAGFGDDVIYGESHDDDIVGGSGHDWIAAGTGDDGVLGDDGRIYTSRNGIAEPLYGLAATTQTHIDTPGDLQQADIFVTGLLNKTVNLTPFNVDPTLTGQDPLYDPVAADDIVYGGLGSDFLHGGAGDDAISGAEALAAFYANPVNPGDVLGFADLRADEFVAYDEFDPMRRIEGFFLNFDANDPAAPLAAGSTKRTDGNDMIFGDLGNDWLVGGTGRDWMFGGFGADLLNADDEHDSNGGANDVPDGPETSYEDIAYGGAGRDVLIGNTGGDRLIDWVGEFNSFLVPFSPFGAFAITRMIAPALQQFLYDLSRGAGADRTRAADTGADAARNGEPFGELGLVNHSDPWWQDQTGAPDDPQPGNTQGRKDVLRFADFNNGTMSGFSADSGQWSIQSGQLYTSATTPTGDAVTVFHVGEQLPSYYELVANIKTVKPTSGWKANSYVIFDYFSPTDFKFAGLDMSTNKVVMGERTTTGWNVTATLAQFRIWPDQYYNLLVAVNGLAVTVTIDNSKSFSYAFQPRMIDGIASNLNWGYVGFGSENARGYLDNIQVKVLERPFTLQTTEDYEDGQANLFTGYSSGDWEVAAGRYEGTVTAGDTAVSLIDLGLPKGIAANARTQLEATLSTASAAGIVFDLYSPTDFKFVLLDVAADRVVVGHRSKKGWSVDATFAKSLAAGVGYDVVVSLAGTTVSVVVDGQAVGAHVFNAVVVDGAFGTIVHGGTASFDRFTLRTSDPVFEESAAESLVAATAATATSASSAFVSYGELAPIVAEAAARWAALVGAPSVDAALARITFAIADLEGQTLAQTVGNVVLIDIDAAGHGWFVDATPGDDAEFTIRAGDGELRAQASSPALGLIDLLTVVMHELGHVLGFAHDDAGEPSVLTSSLDVGLRRLPLIAGGGGTTISGPTDPPIAPESPPPVEPEATVPPPPPAEEPAPDPPPPGKGKGKK